MQQSTEPWPMPSCQNNLLHGRHRTLTVCMQVHHACFEGVQYDQLLTAFVPCYDFSSGCIKEL